MGYNNTSSNYYDGDTQTFRTGIGNITQMTLGVGGAIQFNAYNSTNNTGTPTYLLGTDASGNVVKTLASGGGAAPQTSFDRAGINSSTYTMLFTAAGTGYGSVVNMTVSGTSGNVVIIASFEIIVNHYQDIHVRSLSGDYTELTLRITSDNNASYSVEAKHNGSTTTTVSVCVQPQNNDTITPTTTDPAYAGEEYVHTATEGWRFGGTDGGVESSNLIVDGNVGIGTDSPSNYNSYADNLVVADSAHSGISIASGTTSLGTLMFAGGTGGTAGYRGRVQYDHNTDSMNFHTAAAERLRIQNSSQTLRVKGNSATGSNYIQFVNNSDASQGYIGYGSSDNTLYLAQQVAGDIQFYSAGSTRMTIQTTGNVGIGMTAPTARLQVAGTTTYNSDSAQTLRVCDAADVSKGIHIGFDTVVDAGIIQAGDFGVVYKNLSLNPNAGNVGIGTTSPGSKLDIALTTGPQLRLTRNAGTEYSTLYSDSAGGLVISSYASHTSNYQIFSINSSEKVRIINNGNVGIGVTAPGALLHIRKDQSALTSAIIQNNSGAGASAKLEISVGETGSNDPTVSYNIGNGGFDWSTGVDNSDGDSFKISGGTDSHNVDLGTNTRLKIAATGETTITGGTVSVGDTVFDVQGSLGQLFSVTNDFSGSIFAVADISGVPIFDVNSSGLSTFDGDVAIKNGKKLYFNNPINTASGSIVCPGGGSLSLQAYGNDMIYLNENSEIRFSTSSSEKMRITSAGDVGIGVTAPGNKLHVHETSTVGGKWEVAKFEGDIGVGGGITLSSSSSGAEWSLIAQGASGGALANNLGFHLTDAGTSGGALGYKMTLEASSGYLGIGTTNPIHPLYVAGDIGQTDGSRIWFRGSSSSSTTGSQSYVYSNGLNLQIKGDDNVQILGDSGGIIAHFDYTGNVGIGTTSPGAKLDVAGSINTSGSINLTNAGLNTIAASNPSNGYLRFLVDQQGVALTLNADTTSTFGGIIYAVDGNKATPGYSFASDPDTGMFRDSANVLVLGVNADTRIRITNSDIVTYKPLGINTTSITSGVALDVNGVALIENGTGVGDLYLGNYATANYFRFHTNNSNTYFDMNCGDIYWRQGTSARYQFFASTANMTIQGTLTQNSDARTKENVIEISDCISKVKAMRGVYYNRTDFNTEVTKVGVIAQEVEAVLPELVLESPETGLKSVAYSELTSVLINAIKEQQEIIEDLKTRITKLEN